MNKLFRVFGTKSYFLFLTSYFIFSSCSVQQQIAKSAKADVLNNAALQTAHVGISIYDPAANKYLYNYQGDKYFVPASNTKIPTCYAAMKYLGDSLVGWGIIENRDSLIIFPKGDPTFLHPEFKNQNFFKKLQGSGKKIFYNVIEFDEFKKYGPGWSWNDYLEDYMVERSRFPIYGNIVTFEKRDSVVFVNPEYILKLSYKERKDSLLYYILRNMKSNFFVQRSELKNSFWVIRNKNGASYKKIPFFTGTVYDNEQINMLYDTLNHINPRTYFAYKETMSSPFKTQPTDSLLKPMMHRSDNFFAEQSLLMVSNETLGYMNDEKIIDTILKTDFKDLPQKPRWADGSGLSRYNLFTPQDFVAILNKMKNEFGMERIKVIFPTGGEGTISNYYKADSGYIYAKTGTLSGVVAFSGFLYTKKGKLLIFSTLINNHQANAVDIRKAIEKFIQGVRSKF